MEQELGFQAVPDDHDVTSDLRAVFGDHTFFLNEEGLHILQELEDPDRNDVDAGVIRLATWVDEDKSALAPHEPQPTEAMLKVSGGEA